MAVLHMASHIAGSPPEPPACEPQPDPPDPPSEPAPSRIDVRGQGHGCEATTRSGSNCRNSAIAAYCGDDGAIAVCAVHDPDAER